MTTAEAIQTPLWPTEYIDPLLARGSYNVVADEFLVNFGGRPVLTTSDPLDGPGFGHAAIMIGLDENGEETGDIVGVQVIPMLLGAVRDHP